MAYGYKLVAATLPMVIFISMKMKVAMRTLELGLSRLVVEVAPEARSGHPVGMWT
jgi:hypothetical protein